MSSWINSSQATPFSPTSYTGEEAFTRSRQLQEGMSTLSGAVSRVRNDEPCARFSMSAFHGSLVHSPLADLPAFENRVLNSVKDRLHPAVQAPSWDLYPTLTPEGKQALSALWLSLSPREQALFCPEGKWQWKVAANPSNALILAASKGLYPAISVLLKDCFESHNLEKRLNVVHECLDLRLIEGAYLLLKSGLPWPSDSAALSKTSSANRTLAWMAAQKGDAPFLNELISRGANVDVPDDHHWTPLLVASNDGHLGAVLALANGHVNVDAMDVAGWMPLHRACFHGHPEVAITLISEMGASADIPDHLGRTPLHRAVEHNHVALVKVLCERTHVDPSHPGYVDGYPMPVSAEQLAKDRKQTEICELFEQYRKNS